MSEKLSGIGRVEAVAGEICSVGGLRNISLSNVVEFSSGERGLVLGFTDKLTQIVVIGDYHNIKKGDLAKVESDELRIRVSNELIGRIIDPLGNPLDGKGKVEEGEYYYIESPAKGVSERAQITKPLLTGFLIIDSQIPIGQGQRELLVGDKKIGKGDTAAAIIGNQTRTNSGIIGIYVTIDAQTTAVKRRISQLEQYGALKNSVVIVGRASDSSTINYIAPMSAITIAEVFAKQGKDVIVVFDNLTRHAKVYRQISLLLKRAPGREAYPGDVFYLHSRLLERCGCFAESVGGGSITALPIVETQGEEITDYITTNLMSITDGHILFRLSLANKGIRPAVDSAFSVSRIGGRAQPKIIRELSDQLKDEVVRFHEVEKFAMVGSELQPETLEIIELGERIVLLFNQTVKDIFSLDQEILLLYFVLSKIILNWEIRDIPAVRTQLLEFTNHDSYKKMINGLVNASKTEEIKPVLDKILSDFMSDPKTIAKIEKKDPSPAERESVVDLLKDTAPWQKPADESAKEPVDKVDKNQKTDITKEGDNANT